jgi:hypothetical protein
MKCTCVFQKPAAWSAPYNHFNDKDALLVEIVLLGNRGGSAASGEGRPLPIWLVPFTLMTAPCMSWNTKRRRASAARLASAMKSAQAGVGEGPQDCAGTLVHDLTKVHGEGEQEDQEEKVDPKE